MSEDIRSLSESYGSDILNLTACQKFLKQIMGNNKVSNFLEKHHPELFEKFTEIVELKILSTENVD